MNENRFLPEAGGMTLVEKEKILEEQIKYLLYEAHKINEGQNGIILKVDGFLQDSGTESSSVAKVLKVYNREHFGFGSSEYGKQKQAKDILDQNRADFNGELAYVPTPLLYRDVLLGDDLAEKIRNLGAHVADRSEVLFMDEVPGKDLATILYTEILKRHPSAEYLRNEDFDSWSISDLQQEVARLFFAHAKTVNGSLEQRAQIHERVFRANAETLIEELSSVGFHIDPRVINIIKNSLKCLRRNGIAMLDAHERNFMIEGNIENLGDGKVYIVDFGDAENKGRPVEDDDFVDRRQDMAVPWFLEKLNRLSDEKKRKADGLQWFEKDPKIAAIFSRVRSKELAFRTGKAGIFGFSESRTKTKGKDDKVILLEQALDTAIEQYGKTGYFNGQAVLKVLGENGVKPKSEKIEQNNIWNANAFLEGFLYKVMEAYRKDLLGENDIRNILQNLSKAKIFEKVFKDERYYRYYTSEYFEEELPQILIQMGDYEKNKALESI